MNTTLAEQQALRVNLRKSRLETMALLTVGMIGAGTVNLVPIADERGAVRGTRPRPVGGFFQHVALPQDWAAR